MGLEIAEKWLRNKGTKIDSIGIVVPLSGAFKMDSRFGYRSSDDTEIRIAGAVGLYKFFAENGKTPYLFLCGGKPYRNQNDLETRRTVPSLAGIAVNEVWKEFGDVVVKRRSVFAEGKSTDSLDDIIQGKSIALKKGAVEVVTVSNRNHIAAVAAARKKGLAFFAAEDLLDIQPEEKPSLLLNILEPIGAFTMYIPLIGEDIYHNLARRRIGNGVLIGNPPTS